MKKRNLLVAVLLVITMLITACGGASPFEGKWRGNLDLTQYIMDLMEEEYAEYMEYLHFEDLSFDIYFSFEGDKVSLEVDKSTVEKFVKNAEDGMTVMMDEMMTGMLLAMVPGAKTLDDVAPYFGVADGAAVLEYLAVMSGYENYAKMIADTVKEAAMGSMIDPLVKTLDLEASFKYDEGAGTLKLTYQDGNEEVMKYRFEGNVLVITISDGTSEFDIYCERTAK